MSEKPKVIYIGLPQVGEVLQKIRTDWDFLPPVPNIAKLWEGLYDGSIDNNIQVILVLDNFFDPNGEKTEFETLVAQMSPHCLFGIINYHPNLKEHMKEKIDSENYAMGNAESKPLYYFIDPKQPAPSINEAVQKFIAESDQTEIVNIIAGRVVKTQAATQPTAQIEETPYTPTYIPEEDDEPNQFLGQVVAVTSSKGGSGKSTVAVTLATYIAHASINSYKEKLEDRPLKVLILDLDVRDGQLGFITGNSKPTIINIRVNGVSKDTIEETVISDSRLKCDLLLAPKRPKHSNDTPPEFYVELIQQLRRMYDYIIMDTSVNYLDPLLEKVAYPTADQIIFVTDIVVTSVFSMTRWIQEVTKEKEKNGMGINKNKIGIVVNKVIPEINMPGEKIAQSALGLPVITAIPSNPKLIAHAVNLQSMEVILKHQPIYLAIRRLAKGIVGKRYNLSDNVK